MANCVGQLLGEFKYQMKIRHDTAQEVVNREKRNKSTGGMKESGDGGHFDEIKGKCIH